MVIFSSETVCTVSDHKFKFRQCDMVAPKNTSEHVYVGSERISKFYVGQRVMVSHRNNTSGMHISCQSTDTIMGHLFENERGPLVYRLVIKSFQSLLHGVNNMPIWGF